MFCFKKVVVSESVLKTYTGILQPRTNFPLLILSEKKPEDFYGAPRTRHRIANN